MSRQTAEVRSFIATSYANDVQQSHMTSEDDDDDNEVNNNGDTPLIHAQNADGDFPRARDIFGLMGFLGFASVYAMRVNLSVAIVAMVNQTALPDQNNSAVDDTCPTSWSANNTDTQHAGEFLWDEATQGIILGSFFYGYVLTQIPGGRMAELIGGKRIYGYGVLLTAIFTLLTPIATHADLKILVLVRILEGMAEGVTYPAMHAMLAQWIPPLERNKFAAIVYAGSNIGTVISMPLTGWLCSQQFLGGWPAAFYVFGLLGIIWFIFWMLLVYDRPSMHPRISYKERAYIERSIRAAKPRSFAAELHYETALGESNLDESIPWRQMLRSGPLWALLIISCSTSWGFYTQLTELPTYMNNILHFDIESNALLNALPNLTSWCVGIACSALADWSLKKGYISQLNSYKLWTTISCLVPALGLVGVGYVGCSWQWVTVMLAGVGSLGGAIYSGYQMNHIALSPRYAGTMYGITNSAANICGFLAPYVIGSIINHNETMAQWRVVFWLAALISMSGNFVYLIFASDEEQSWSRPGSRI